MKILSCITDPVEIPYVIRAGACEVYFAVSWLANYANSGALKDFEQLKKAINICKRYSIKFHLAVNDFRVPQEEDEYKILERTLGYGINSVIVADVGLGRYIANNFPHVEIHISSLLSVMNIKTLEFLSKNLKGFKRLIIPNHLSAYDAKPLMEWCKDKDIITEVFFFRHFGCTYLNGYCYLHGDRYLEGDFSREGSICRFGCGGFKARITSLGTPNKKVISRIDERLNYGKIPRILNASSFFDYYVYGVDFVKYGTRTDPTKVKLEKISFIKNILIKLEQLISRYGLDEAKKMFIEMVSRL